MRNTRPAPVGHRAWSEGEWAEMPHTLEALGLDHVEKTDDEGFPMYDLVEAPLTVAPSMDVRGDIRTSLACAVVNAVFGLGDVCDLPLAPPA